MKEYINTRNIAILMSTYNGEKFVDEQICSILNQSYTDFTLYIRDDCSTDHTLEVINKYKEFPNVVVIEGQNNLGSNRSFLSLLENIQSDYYMFSDQDDVWLPDKIAKSIEHIKIEENVNQSVVPTIVHTDLYLVDGSLNPIAPSYWQHCKVGTKYPHTFEMLCHYNDVTGCAMIFNKEVRNLYLCYRGIVLHHSMYHDSLLNILVAKAHGKIVPLYESTILFRRHGNNSTNPLVKNKSIFEEPYRIVSYICDQYDRYKFYKTLGYNSFIKFLYYKCLLKYYQKNG